MQKKNLKPLTLSSLAAVAMAGVGAGATFALFTDKAETTINVTAGIVDLAQTAKLVRYESSVGGTPKDFGPNQTTYTNELVGSKFEIDGNTIDISKMVPGDKITLELENVNLSNVKTKTRFVLNHSHQENSVDLFDALTIAYEAKTADNTDFSEDLFKWHELDAASSASGDVISKIKIAIEFPNTDNLITAREEGADNYYQNANCKISFGQEMVQGNATVSDVDVAYPGVSIEKENEMTRLMSLGRFRDLVNNSSDGLSGYTVTLHDDVDLNNVEWTPIGTTEHPFSGVFDGQNYTIKNYKIRGAGENVGLALFGCIKGTASTLTSATDLSAFYSATNYNVNLPDEEVFTCVVKNLNVSGADVNTTADGWSAAVVSYVKDATVSNVRLSSSTIAANEKAGGIVGFLPDNYACFVTDCTTSSDVTISTSKGNHAAGILGRINGDKSRAIVANSVNNATITCAGVNGSGIAGQAKNALYYNDVNNGAITGKTRAAGIATDCSGSVFINCTNTGYIKNTGAMVRSTDSSAGIAAYLASSGTNVIVNCLNTGTVEGSAGTDDAKIAGIVAGGVNTSAVILNNANTGTLINHAENGKTYDICNLSTVANVVNAEGLDAINAATATDNKYIRFTGEATLAAGDTVTLNGQEKIEFVNSPAHLTVDLENADVNSFVLVANDTNIKLINGEGKNVTVSGKGNTVIVENGESIKSLTVMNDDAQESALDFAGTADALVLSGTGKVAAQVKEGASVSRFSFGGTGTYALTNKGTISHTQNDANPHGNEHTIATIKGCNITINNYGTIEAKANNDGVASYALLFYGGATVNLYAYDGSKIVAGGDKSAIVTNGGTQMNVYYQDGAEVTVHGQQSTYPKAFGYYCTVAEMN